MQSLAIGGERATGILEVAADGILTIDESGLIEYVNPAISQIFGFDADELIGQNVRLLMPAPHEKAHDGYLENYRRTRERKILGVGREVIARHRDGTSFPIELAVSEIFEGSRRTFTGTIRDISARREAETVIREDHDRLRGIFDSAIDGIVVIDESGKILEVNRAVERTFGYTSDKLLH